MRGRAKPSSFIAASPSSMVRRMRPSSRSQASRSATCVVTCTVERRSLASSMRDSLAPHSSAMYSVCPENGRPESVTASLLSGAVTMASASPRRHNSVAMRTYATPAAPQRASSLPKAKPVRSSSPSRVSWSCAWPSGIRSALHHGQDARVAHHDPASQRGDLRVGQRLEDDFRTDAGGVAGGQRNGGKVRDGWGHAKKSATSLEHPGRRIRRTW